MSRYFTTRISADQLQKLILNRLEDIGGFKFPNGTTLADCYDNPNNELLRLIDLVDMSFKSLTNDVKNDLMKVEFDTENLLIGEEGGYIPQGMELLGLHTLDNGLSFLGLCSGGDWEIPVFYIIYFDGKKLRGYIPKEGNTWNTDTNIAYGNDDEEDVNNAIKRGWGSMECAQFDSEKIKTDIQNRIKEKVLL